MTLKILKLSLKAIWNNKLRSILTMLGIIIGVMAVVVLVSITQGATEGITSSIADMGSDRITAKITDEDISLSVETVEALADYGMIDSVAPVVSVSKTVKKGTATGNYSIYGITPDYFTVQDVDIQRGRTIYDSDIEWTTSVCVIGTDVATDLFGTWDAVDGTITIGDRIYKVVGVLEEQGSSLSGVGNSSVLIPYSTAARMTGEDSVSTFYIKATSNDTVNTAINITETFLLQATRDEDAFSVSNESSVLETMDEVDNTMSLLIGGIAAISLIVGGIGIMNIMLVSVTERTREIGIRKAVGAKRRHIMFQFLCEACVLSVLGGLIGLGLSFAGVEIYSLVVGTSYAVNWAVGGASVAFCAVIGVAFGLYPAAKASKLQPIDALHNS